MKKKGKNLAAEFGRQGGNALFAKVGSEGMRAIALKRWRRRGKKAVVRRNSRSKKQVIHTADKMKSQ